MHYTQKELTAIKQKLGLRWVNSWGGTQLKEGTCNSHFRVESFISKKSGELRYRLSADKTTLRIATEMDKPFNGTSTLGVFDDRKTAMAFAEWLLVVVDEQEEAAKALRAEKQRMENEKRAVERAAYEAKREAAEKVVTRLALFGIKAAVSFDGSKVELTPADVTAMLASDFGREVAS